MVRRVNIARYISVLAMASVVAILFACSGQNGRNVTDSEGLVKAEESASIQPDISFDTLSHDFGTIIEGEMVVCYFEFTNVGQGDLVINSVKTTCGCTTPDWSKAPLKAGESDQLKVVFNSVGRSGSQLKTVTVESNALSPVVKLSIRANVIKRK